MRTDIHIGIFDLIIFLGIFQGLLLAWFFLRNTGRSKPANLYQGLLLLTLSLIIFEELLNNTGAIVRVLHLSNFSEPLNLTIGPLIYLYVKRSMREEGNKRTEVLHFVLFFVYLLYMGFYFLQPEAKRMLKSPGDKNLTIEEIAEKVGYNSKSSFNTAFKKITGQTPSQYRAS